MNVNSSQNPQPIGAFTEATAKFRDEANSQSHARPTQSKPSGGRSGSDASSQIPSEPPRSSPILICYYPSSNFVRAYSQRASAYVHDSSENEVSTLKANRSLEQMIIKLEQQVERKLEILSRYDYDGVPLVQK
ncbi:hypothetical protein C8R48DRAFT_766470 [Suillus tomentosus]|nr:hypothetical protein C8R48DRAFT_766470 [Suillus tomentosus]